MTLNEAFYALTIEQIETALAADATYGFPQDVFGLAKLVMRTFLVLEPDCAKLDSSSAKPLEADDEVEQRIKAILELERLKISRLEEPISFVGRPSDTRH